MSRVVRAHAINRAYGTPLWPQAFVFGLRSQFVDSEVVMLMNVTERNIAFIMAAFHTNQPWQLASALNKL